MKRNVVVSLIIVIVMLALVGCASSTNVSETPAQTETEQDVAKDATTLAESDVKIAEKIEETVSDVKTQETAEEWETTIESEVEIFETAFDWAIAINVMEPTLTIWNKDSKEGIVLENNAEYTVKDGDQLVMCYPNKSHGLHFLKSSDGGKTPQTDILGLIEATSVHFTFDFIKESFESTFIEIDPVIDEIEYDLNITVVSEQAGEEAFLSEDGTNEEVTETGEFKEVESKPVVYEGLDMASTLPGTEWIATFEGIITEPKIVICNDSTNKKVIVENEQKVTFAEGDIFFIYTPNGEFITTHNMPITQDIRFSLYTMFEIDMTQLVTKTAVSVEFMDEADNTNYLKCTLVPE